MALFEATLLQLYADQECVNRFYYRSDSEPAVGSLSFLLVRGLGAVAVAGVYPATKLMKLISNAQSAGVQFTTLTVKRLYSATDFYSLPFIETLNGALAGEAASPTVALGFRTNRTRSDIHRATKRFVGVPEAVMGDKGILTNDYITTQCSALALGMGAAITEVDEGNTVIYTPVVLGKQRYNPDTGLPAADGRAYRLYPTEAEQLSHVMSSIAWDVYNSVRTQTSRQYGRGR